MTRYTSEEVLKYNGKGTQSTVRRHYERWRNKQGIPDRCDNEECQFHLTPLVWNGVPITPILDHTNGVRRDNRPKNLRFLCPNCDAQLATRGGGNKGRVEMDEGGFSIRRPGSELRDHTLPAETGKYTIKTGE